MKFIAIIFAFFGGNFISCYSQSSVTEQKNMRASAASFLQTLSSKQQEKACFSFTDEERFNWHFVPRARKGIQLKELNDKQIKAAYNLLHTGLSDSGFQKTTAIIQLENILRVVENRLPEDDYRDPGKYFFPFLETRLKIRSGVGVLKDIIFLSTSLLKTTGSFPVRQASSALILLLFCQALKKENTY